MKLKLIDAVTSELARQDISQAELGRMCGMRRVHVNAALNGTGDGVSLSRYISMAEALGVDVELRLKRRRS